MNTKQMIVSAVLLGAFGFGMTACGNKAGKAPKDEEKVSIPCSGPEFWTDKKNFRSNGIGESMDRMTAKKKAMDNARAQMATDINATIQVVSDNYVKSTEVNNTEDLLEVFQQNARTVVEQQLVGVRTICEDMRQNTASKNYVYYVALELSADDLVSAYNERLSEDERLRADYNYEKFKETFDAEMDKLREERR